jgi:NADPH2:quinone reductase
MKAVLAKKTGSPEVLEYLDVETPKPGKGEVLIKTHSISVNYADVRMRQGLSSTEIPLPLIPGLEASGTIEALGEGVHKFQPGQMVVTIGHSCYAEFVCSNADSVIRIPETFDMDKAAAFPINYLTAYHMMHTMANLKQNQTILVYAAAGGVGTAVIQLANISGFIVIGLTSNGKKAAYAREQGISHIINHMDEDVPGRVAEITDGKGVDLILDGVGGETFEQNFDMLAPLGQIIWFGHAGGSAKADVLGQLRQNFRKGVGVRVFHVLYSIAQPYPLLMTQSIQLMVDYLIQGKIKPSIYEKLPLSQAARAHELIENREVMGKLLLKP